MNRQIEELVIGPAYDKHNDACASSAPRREIAAPLSEKPLRAIDKSPGRPLVPSDPSSASDAYWKQQLAGPLPVLELPTDRPRPANRPFRGATLEFAIPESFSAPLAALGRSECTTLFTTFLAAFKTLLWRYSGQSDILVGGPVAEVPEANGRSGPTTSFLAFRTDVGGNPTFRELLTRVRTTVIEGRAHADSPVEQWRRIAPRRGETSETSLFQHVFTMTDASDNECGASRFDVALHMAASENELCGRLDYNADLFDADRMERMVGHWSTLLAGIAANPDQRLSELPLLTAAERQQLLVTWNSAQTDAVSETCLHEFFERHAQRKPDAVALTFADQQWTYGEINIQSNRLAHHLRTLGVGPDVPVAICVERSPEMIIGVLAILKAGGAYVPLDPTYPAEQLAFMLKDAEAPVLLTTRRLAANLPLQGIHLICLEAAGLALADQPTSNPVRTAGAENTAYIIYTSGSTGRPKGVVVDHGSVVHLLRSRAQFFDDTIERFALIASIAFDASVVVIFTTLSNGGTLALPAQGAEQDVVRLCEWIQKQRVSHWASVASLYDLLLEQPPERLASLRTVSVGGEVCPPATVRRHRELLPNTKLYNEYGPTEGTVCSTAYPCAVDPADRSVPIGRPLPNVRVYVLDSYLNPVPVGVPGELYLGGAGVARGYLRRPELTAERFIPDPFGALGGRLYKTGDLVRYLPDGNLDFLGRIDNQVKIRGHRVELGEIETALCRDPAISQAVVLVRQAKGKRQQLVAHVVSKQSPPPFSTQLRRVLRDRLPEHMIPAHFRVYDALPLTPNGKIDHRALSMLDLQAVARRDHTPPADEIESKLATIWEQLFDLQPIGVYDDFFDLGGDSLLAAGLGARIEQEFRQVFSPDLLLERPTVRQLAVLFRSPPARDRDPAIITIQAGQSRTPLFCLPGIGGNVMEFRGLAQLLGLAQPVYGFRPIGAGDGQSPHESIVEMATHNIQQMRRVQPHGPYYLVGYSLGGVVAFEMALQLRDAGETTALLALLDSRLWFPQVSLTMTQRMRLHWRNLYRNSALGRWHYLQERGRLLAARILRGNLRHAEDDVVIGLDLSPASRKLAHVHWKAWRDYQPRVLDGKITLFVAQQHPELVRAINGDDPTLGWERWTTKPVVVNSTIGTHVEILRADGLNVLAECIARCLRTSSEAAAHQEF